MRNPIFFLSFLVLCACSPDSLDDYQKEGQLLCRHLAKELKNIHTREELLKSELSIKKKFDQLVELILEARQYQIKHPDEYATTSEEQSPFSEELLFELKRLYAHIEGGREIIERAQKEALIRLDGFEKKLEKQKKKLR
ncbi:MAG TPA: hypothetical protein VLF61_01595 [Rhabdochlamydiaceae bacterium]|nr:hypothetical protein [Rhabdochlamydiaceae bacterium]